jgi:hypothetical protein
VKKVHLEKIKKYKNVKVYQFNIGGEAWRDRLNKFIEWHYYDRRLVNLFMSKIKEDNNGFLFELPSLIPHLEQIDENEYEKRWDKLISLAKPGDHLFVYNPKSIVSRTITRLIGLPWSHCAIITVESNLIEMLTSGIKKRPIEVYRNGEIRVGLYKTNQILNNKETSKMLSHLEMKYIIGGLKYGYLTAIKIGILNFFGKTATDSPSPMDIIYSGVLRLSCYV